MVTASQVDKAGRILRVTFGGISSGPATATDGEWALTVLSSFRAAHSQPLIKANNGLRSVLRTEGCPNEVSQRLKRASTIIDKLVRYPSMALSRMQDIGGCRAVLDDLDQLRRVERRVAGNRPPLRVDDYVSEPQQSGYRAVHLVVRYDDRRIEVQLRTRRMHQWALAVEQLGSRTGYDLKSGKGPEPLLAWLAAVAEVLAIADEGRRVEDVMVQDLLRLRQHALPFMS